MTATGGRIGEMTAHEIFGAARAKGRTALDEAAAKRLLAHYGVPVPNGVVVRTASDAAAGLSGLTPPFAVKVMSPQILHKSDAGGVRLGLQHADAVREAIAGMSRRPAIAAAALDGWLVEEMAAPGLEIVIGALRDRRFGWMLMVGLGGIFVEVLADVAFRICPITREDACSMLDELRGRALLDGARGGEPVAREAIIDLLLRLGGANGLLARHAVEIAEVDLNPVIVTPGGAVVADARFLLGPVTLPLTEPVHAPRDELPVLERFAPLLAPRTIAVVGASGSGVTIANTFIRRLKDYGYAGRIYPIHPKAGEIEGLAAYASLAAIPEPVDYAYIAIGAERIPGMIAASAGRVHFAQVISSGFAEVEGGEALEHDLVRKAHAAGCRVIGPNCLGLYSPRAGVSFSADAPKDPGGVGVISQSGGLSTDIIKRGQWRGVRFSAVISIGNSADLGPADLLEYFLADAHTRVIGLYLEDVKDGRRFFELMRGAPKPVVILRGGRSRQGHLAAASHTGALAGDARAWNALERQTPCVETHTVDAFLEALLVLQQLALRRGRPTRNVVLFGNGGGTSVLAADTFAEFGLDILPFDAATRRRLEALELPPGTSVANPIDTPVGTLQEKAGFVARTILDIVYESARPDAIVMHINLAAFVGRGNADTVANLISVVETVQAARRGEAHFILVLRSDGSPELDEAKRAYRARALAAAIPVYDEIANAAEALAAVSHLEARLKP